jgi:hypothetical protein
MFYNLGKKLKYRFVNGRLLQRLLSPDQNLEKSIEIHGQLLCLTRLAFIAKFNKNLSCAGHYIYVPNGSYAPYFAVFGFDAKFKRFPDSHGATSNTIKLSMNRLGSLGYSITICPHISHRCTLTGMMLSTA